MKPSILRYGLAFFALLLALLLTIRFSERGMLLDTATSEALARTTQTEGVWDLQGMTIVNRVILQMRDSYVDPSRVDPGRMLVHALDGIQTFVPEVVALFDRDLTEGPRSVELRAGAQSRRFSLEGVDSLWAMSHRLREVFRFLQASLDPQEVDLQDVEYAAVNGALRTLDPYSVMMTPRAFTEMQASNRGSFGGVGIVISIRNGQLTVISPISNTPAARAGIRAGDVIVKINEESTINMPLDEAVSRLRGPPGTDVTMSLMRQGWTEPGVFPLRREVIAIESVKSHALGDGIGYIEISNFQRNTASDLRSALNGLRDEMGQLRGLVLDMRNNPGGLLDQAIHVANTFLDQGVIVTTVGYGNTMREERPASRGGTEPRYPIVVLVNEGSASASEIVAGALQNHNRAVLLGDRTFGKGTVQYLYDFSDGSALKLTIAQYLTPGDRSIQGRGIMPDIQAQAVQITDDRIDLYPSPRRAREGELEAWAQANGLEEDHHPAVVVRHLEEPQDVDPDAIVDPNEFRIDFEIRLARAILGGAGEVWERNALLGHAQRAIARVAQEEALQIQERLRQRNVDWASGDTIAQPVELQMRTNRRGDTVEAGETIDIEVTVTNRGRRPLYRVRALSESDHRIFDDLEFVFGRLMPGQSRSWTVPVRVPQEEPTRIDTITLRAFADEIDLQSATTQFLHVLGQERPAWGFSYRIDDSAGGNGDGMLQVGETASIEINVTNLGAGPSNATLVALRNRSDAAIFLHTGREEVPSIASGATHRSRFSFDLRSLPEDGTPKVAVEIYDTVFREFLTYEIPLPVGPEQGPAPIAVEGERLQVPERTTLLHAPLADSALPLVAVDEGTLLPITHRLGSWVQVATAEGPGWLRARSEWVSPGQAPPPPAQPMVALQPPQIQIEVSELRTRGESVRVRGVITDPQGVRDYHLSVAHPRARSAFQATKRTYHYIGGAQAVMDEEVVLRPGANRITVWSRSQGQITATRFVYVFREDPDTTSARP